MTVFDSVTGERITKKHRFTSFEIRKGSAVDRPAQTPAVAVLLMKRSDDAPKIEAATPGMVTATMGNLSFTQKGYVADEPALTNTEAGHQHTVDLSQSSGYTSWESVGDRSDHVSEHGHSHPYVVTTEGLVVGESNGHTHNGIAAVAAKNAEPGDNDNGEPMSDKKTPAAGENKDAERITQLETELATQKQLATMTDAQKEHYATLEGEPAKEFLSADASKRVATVEAAKSADAIVYKSLSDGTEYRASDDPRLVDMAKREDKREAEAKKARDANAVLVYKNRAAKEVPHLVGGEDVQVALLKAVDTIEDEELRGKALEALHANDAGVRKGFERAGTNGAPPADGGSAEDKLTAMANKRAADKGVTFEKAYTEVTQTPEGKELLSQHSDERNQAAGLVG